MISGAARLLDFSGLFDVYNMHANSDYEALFSDWYAIGSDIQYAIDAFESFSDTETCSPETHPGTPRDSPTQK